MVIKTTKRSAFATQLTKTEERNINVFFSNIDLKGNVFWTKTHKRVRITPDKKLTDISPMLTEYLAGALEALTDKEFYARLNLVSDRLTLAGGIKPQQVQVSEDPVKYETMITKEENIAIRKAVYAEIASENKLPLNVE